MKNKKIFFFTIIFFFLFGLIYSKSVQEYVESGINFLNQERYFDAIAEFRDAININPYYARAYLYLGKTYYELKDYNTSLEHGLNALKYANNDLESQLLVANSYRELNDYKKAEEIYKKILKQFPTHIEALLSVSEYYIKINKLSIAYDYLSKAERIDKSSYKVARYMGEYYAKKQNFEKAEEYFKKSFNLNPYDRSVFTTLAKFYIDQKRIKEAITILESGEKLHENFYNGISMLAECYLSMGKLDKNYYRKAIEKLNWLISNTKKIDNKNLAFLYYKLALAYEENQVEKAIENYERAIELYPENQLIRFSYENFAIKNLPINSEIRQQLSDFHFKKSSSTKLEGDLNLYFFHLKRAITIYPFFLKARLELIDYYESRSDFFNAYDELKKLSKISDSYSIKDKIEKYEWKLKKEKYFEKPEYLQYKGTIIVESEYYNFDKIFSDIAIYFFQYYDKFKFSALEFRKNQGINYILEHLNKNEENFFVLIKIDNNSLIGFYIYDKTGKLMKDFFIKFNENELAYSVVRFYNLLDNFFPSIWKVNKKDSEYMLTAGYYEKLKENDELTTFDIINMNFSIKNRALIRNVTPYSAILKSKEEKNKKSENMGKYAVKSEFITEKYLTNWKRALGY